MGALRPVLECSFLALGHTCRRRIAALSRGVAVFQDVHSVEHRPELRAHALHRFRGRRRAQRPHH
eukprot:1645909-Alexandrium_andersonii.AAC.1